MSGDIETYIRQKCSFSKLPLSIRQILGDSPKEYDRRVISFSVKNQLRYRNNLVRAVMKDERAYYEELLRYSREHLMLYPYHLSDFTVTRMRMTPFQYYISILQDLMEHEKSYDSLPNFTAADCLRLLGIGRNQYIELMNQCRSSKKFFRRKPIRLLLPSKPVAGMTIEPWWLVNIGYVTEDDIKIISQGEKIIIDKIIDDGVQRAGDLELNDLIDVYRRGLIYLDVPIEDDDCVSVPPLEGFVMNRILGDYLETLLYKIFVSIDEHTTISELTNILQVDLELVKNAVSMYCRLGFARKKNQEDITLFHSSWLQYASKLASKVAPRLLKSGSAESDSSSESQASECSDQSPGIGVRLKRIGFLFDSTLTAFLMMGNLSPGLKCHAVTMFEVGKLTDESLDSFLVELLKVSDVGEGEARRYFDHALTLRDTILFLRRNPAFVSSTDASGYGETGFGLDLLRCESLQNLDMETCSRLLNKNYSLLISMAPLTNEIRPISSCSPPHLGPPIPEVSSVWFRLFLYSLTTCGPLSLLLTKGTRLRNLPKEFRDHEKLLITTWSHDPSTVPMSNALPILNDALCHSSVLVQGQGSVVEFSYVPFPLADKEDENVPENVKTTLEKHSAVKILSKELDLENNCGYITLMKISSSVSCAQRNKGNLTIPETKTKEGIESSTSLPSCSKTQDQKSMSSPLTLDFPCDISKEMKSLSIVEKQDWSVLDCSFGIPLFNGPLNKSVCERLLEKKFYNEKRLAKLTASNRKLCLQLLEFITKYQPVIESRNTSFLPKRPGGKSELPLPTENLLFSNGKLTFWDHK